MDKWIKYEGKSLNGNNKETLEWVTPGECMQACCTAVYNCVSFDYEVDAYKCHLSEDSVLTMPSEEHSDTGYDHYLKPTDDVLVGQIGDGDPSGSITVTQEVAGQVVTFSSFGF